MTRRRTSTVMLSLVTVAALAAPLPSHAATVVRLDPRGDAPAPIDITRAKYSHTSERISVVARIPRLGDRGEAALSITKFDLFEAGHVVRIRKKPGTAAKVRLLFFNHFDLEPRSCAGVTGSWEEHRIRLSVPRACIGDDATAAPFAQFGIALGEKVDRARAVRHLSQS